MKFSKVLGQEKIKQRLIRSVEDNRISHAQLFLGGEGTGKLAMALAYAQYLNCKNKVDGDACGQCTSCKKIAHLTHPDLHFVYPVAPTKTHPKKPLSKDFLTEWRAFVLQNPYPTLFEWYEFIGLEKKQGIINAENCNEIIRTLGLKTYEAEYKVMIIWMVERLFHAAAPKLLKILEEPPSKTLFVLIANNQDQILKTILSRTQMVKFPAIESAHIKKSLVEAHNCSEREAFIISKLADGNYNYALQLIGETGDNADLDTFILWMRNCYARKFVDLVAWVNEISAIGRERQKIFLKYTQRIFRESLMVNISNQGLARLTEKEQEFVNKFNPFTNPANIVQLNAEIQKAIFHIERNVNPKMVFMDLTLKISNLVRIATTN